MDHFTYKNGILHAEDVPIDALATEIATPFYCYSTATLTHHFNIFNSALKSKNRKICFAVKANPNIAVLKTLAQIGAGADVVSEGELRLAMAAGISPQNIVFSGVAKNRDEIAFTLKQNIFQFNVESTAELEMLNNIAGEMNVIAPAALRVNPDIDPKTHQKISTGQKETKFGIAYNDIIPLFAHAEAYKNVKLQAISMHIGSQLTSLKPFRQAFRAMLELVNNLRAQGYDITCLDLGGGLGIPYGNEAKPPPTPAEYGAAVNEELQDFDGILLFEPGRMIAGNAGIMVCQIIYLKSTAHKNFVIIDAGMNDLLRPILYDAYHEVVKVKCNNAAATQNHNSLRYDIVGPICETSDTLATNRVLANPKAGDLLAFRSCGAYGASMSSTYNSRPLIPELLVSGDKWSIIRNRPSYEQMLASQSLPPWLK